MLNDIKIKTAKPAEKDYKLSDEKGLYLFVKTTGSKLWRAAYRFDGKQKTLSLGTYPVVTLADARAKHLEARKLLDRGVDPSEVKKNAKTARIDALANSFEAVAREWVLVAKQGKVAVRQLPLCRQHAVWYGHRHHATWWRGYHHTNQLLPYRSSGQHYCHL